MKTITYEETKTNELVEIKYVESSNTLYINYTNNFMAVPLNMN